MERHFIVAVLGLHLDTLWNAWLFWHLDFWLLMFCLSFHRAGSSTGPSAYLDLVDTESFGILSRGSTQESEAPAESMASVLKRFCGVNLPMRLRRIEIPHNRKLSRAPCQFLKSLAVDDSLFQDGSFTCPQYTVIAANEGSHDTVKFRYPAGGLYYFFLCAGISQSFSC